MGDDPSRSMTLTRSSRPSSKRLLDIENMLEPLDIQWKDKEDLMKRLYFFDDLYTHMLKDEFNTMFDGEYRDHYIHITPAYSRFTTDKTNYEPIYNELHRLEFNKYKGGKRKALKTRRQRKTRRKTRR